MQLTIAEDTHTFIPLQAFRSQWGLPDDFNLAHFEPKDWQGLGSLDGSGKALATVRQRVSEAFALARRIAEVCDARGIPALFPKVFQHYPDLGDDLDLLVVSPSRSVDTAILEGFRAARRPGD